MPCSIFLLTIFHTITKYMFPISPIWIAVFMYANCMNNSLSPVYIWCWSYIWDESPQIFTKPLHPRISIFLKFHTKKMTQFCYTCRDAIRICFKICSKICFQISVINDLSYSIFRSFLLLH